MKFKEFISQQAMTEKLPFQMLGNIPKRWKDSPKEEIAGLGFPKINTLVAREVWFREFLATTVSNRRVELQISLFSLAKKFKQECGDEKMTDSQALKMLMNLANGASGENGVVNEEHESFFMRHLGDFQALMNLMQGLTDGVMEKLSLATFFIASRVDPEWEFEDTATLYPQELQAIVDFIDLEANEGKPPEETNATEEADLGKSLTPSSSN